MLNFWQLLKKRGAVKILWYLLWGLLIIHLVIALPRWRKIAPQLIKKKFSWRIWNYCAGIINFGAKAGLYLTVLSVLLISLVFSGLLAGKQNMLEKIRSSRTAKITDNAARNELVDVRGQIHMHCYLSHDSKGTLEEITLAAKKNGVQWIILTDHLRKLPPGNYPDLMNGVLIIYGCENNGPAGSSLLRASLKDPATILHLHGHLENFCRLTEKEVGSGLIVKDAEIDGIELVNFHANAVMRAGRIAASVFLDPDSIYDSLPEPFPPILEYWQKLAIKAGRPIPIFAAPDAHQNQKILGIQVDSYELILGMVSTHIWIEQGKELNQASIFEAIKRGRTYIAFDYLGDPTGFQFCAKADGQLSFTGDTAKKPWLVNVTLPDSAGASAKLEIRFFRNNKLVETDGGNRYWDPRPGFWRVEVWKNEKLWIISGQILIK